MVADIPWIYATLKGDGKTHTLHFGLVNQFGFYQTGPYNLDGSFISSYHPKVSSEPEQQFQRNSVLCLASLLHYCRVHKHSTI